MSTDSGRRAPGAARQEAAEDDAPVATAPGDESPAPDGPVGPSSEEEAAFIAEQRSLDPGAHLLAPAAESPAAPSAPTAAPLPPMEDLVRRIPTPVRDVLEELFRARFVTVKRLPRTVLK